MAKEEKKTPKPKGGAREGAGRPALGGDIGSKHITAKIRKDYYEIIRDNYDNINRFIRLAIYEKLRREGLVDRESQD